MTPHDLLNELKTRGVTLQLEGNNLRYAPVEAVDHALLEAMQQHKPDLLRHLQECCICELLHRYYLGQFVPSVRTRLETICKDDPPDAWERLLTACDYLNITGEHLEEVAEEALEKSNRQTDIHRQIALPLA
jgi:hypothetical protein